MNFLRFWCTFLKEAFVEHVCPCFKMMKYWFKNSNESSFSGNPDVLDLNDDDDDMDDEEEPNGDDAEMQEIEHTVDGISEALTIKTSADNGQQRQPGKENITLWVTPSTAR